MRRGSIIQIGAIALVAGAITTAAATLIPWMPTSAGEEATRIDFVYWVATIISIGVFAIVIAVLVFTVWKFRAAPDDDSDGPPIHGHTKLEIAWTAVPAALVTVIAIVSGVVLAQNSRAGSDPLNVKVTAQQFAWTFTYPNGKTYGSLTVPKGRHIRLDLTSKDVIHAFWVPELSQQQDAVPGENNSIIITPTRTGTFPVICTELCGVGHALMRSHITILEPAQFAAWMKSGGQAAAGPPGLAVFQQNGCSSCHTLAAAHATGKIGPDLDKLEQYAAQAKRGSLTAFIKESIVSPGAYIQPGFSDLMPHIFGQQIPTDKLDQLVQYLAAGSKSG